METINVTGPQNLIAFLMPVAIDFLNSRVEDGRTRYLIAWGLCIAAGILVHADKLLAGDWANLGANIGAIFLTAQTTYHLYWKQSQPREKLLDKLDE